MHWLDLVKRDPVPWLLDPANPSARLLTLRYLLGKPSASLQEDGARLLAWSPIKVLREHWNSVNFWGRENNPYFGGLMGNFGTLYFLSQLDVPLFAEVEPACENLLNKGRRTDGRFSPEEAVAAPWLCYTGMALQMLWHFGFGNDLRTRSATIALTQTVLLRPELLACPIAGGDCHHGWVKALAALIQIPAAQRTVDDEAAIDVLSERLIDYPYDFGRGDAEWLRPAFPRYYRADLLELCRVLAKTPYRTHHRFQELLQRMLALQTDEGRWCKMQPTPAISEERIHHPSRWLTFEAIHALTLTYGDQSYAA